MACTARAGVLARLRILLDGSGAIGGPSRVRGDSASLLALDGKLLGMRITKIGRRWGNKEARKVDGRRDLGEDMDGLDW